MRSGASGTLTHGCHLAGNARADARSRRLDRGARGARGARGSRRARARASPRACPPSRRVARARSNAFATRLRVLAMLPLQHINPIADDRVRAFTAFARSSPTALHRRRRRRRRRRLFRLARLRPPPPPPPLPRENVASSPAPTTSRNNGISESIAQRKRRGAKSGSSTAYLPASSATATEPRENHPAST